MPATIINMWSVAHSRWLSCSLPMSSTSRSSTRRNYPFLENNNSTLDILDEVMYELKWMLTMQDPDDGGVYHKLTNANFNKFIMPSECDSARYVVQKSVTATLDFAAVMAKAARIYKGSKDYPDFSATAAEAARKAWGWAKAHPLKFYNQNLINRAAS